MYSKLSFDEYSKSPKPCLKCSSPIPYEKRENKNCSRSCANSKAHTQESKNKTRLALSGRSRPEITKKRPTNCCVCNDEIIRIPGRRKYPICNNMECRRVIGSITGRSKKVTLRSKQEVELFDLCSKYFTNVSNNLQIINGWDCDIFLPDFNIAVLWNGPWHYKQMPHKNHSLSQVVNRDLLKLQEFEKLGIQTLIFEDRHFSPLEAFIEIIIASKRAKSTQ